MLTFVHFTEHHDNVIPKKLKSILEELLFLDWHLMCSTHRVRYETFYRFPFVFSPYYYCRKHTIYSTSSLLIQIGCCNCSLFFFTRTPSESVFMLLFLFLFIFAYCLLLLRSVRIDKTSMDYAYVSVISVRCGESISMWNRFYKQNQSEEINGIAVDSVDEENVQDHYAYLLQTREKNFENAFVEHSSSKLSKLYREYANKVNTILEYQNNTSLANKFHSLQYNSSGKTCDGCFLQMSIKTFAKVPRNELLLRKFVGNRETLEIYTPDTRKNGLCM